MLFVVCAQHAYVRPRCVSCVLLQPEIAVTGHCNQGVVGFFACILMPPHVAKLSCKIACGPVAGCRGYLYIYLRAAFYNLSLLTTQPLSLMFNVF